VQAARRGDRAAFGALYERHVRLVHGVLLARAAAYDVDDLVQEAFVTAWRRLGELREAGSFAAWVVAIARNVSVDHHRKSLRVLGPKDAMPVDREIPSAAAPDAPAEARAALDAIRELPVAYRETLVLRLVEGLTGPEIAERAGLDHGSVRVNLHRGMKLLRERLLGAAS